MTTKTPKVVAAPSDARARIDWLNRAVISDAAGSADATLVCGPSDETAICGSSGYRLRVHTGPMGGCIMVFPTNSVRIFSRGEASS